MTEGKVACGLEEEEFVFGVCGGSTRIGRLHGIIDLWGEVSARYYVGGYFNGGWVVVWGCGMRFVVRGWRE